MASPIRPADNLTKELQVLTDTVFIQSLSVDTVIGVYDWEKKIQQTLLFDIEMTTDIAAAAASDDLADTLDYEAVSNRVIEHVKNARVELLETLIEQVAQIILVEFGVKQVALTVHKPGAVKAAKSVGLQIVRRAD
ncbi:7,8-dihydroneopterin aldolase [Neiella marina]|uniref:7,8-dihydroneopterin aldolase n=1 Tax=Neiella marina TaxID=508461 RepID=A0A8J2U6H0_9GAMM|nr:dihydroneopterin aldolase [Neiella marina]GGA81844.1 7,8-dihydroneopterin aldolase [Neiella marina]